MADADQNEKTGAGGSGLPPHHCVVVVHGIGQQVRGSTLAEVGEPLTELFERYLSADGRVQVETDLSPASHEGAACLVRFQRRATAAGLPPETLVWMREAWWAERFLPPSFGPVLVWLLPMWWSQVWSILIGMQRTIGIPSRWEPPTPVDPVYQSLEPTHSTRVYDLILGVLLLLLFTLGAPIVFLVVLLAWAFQGVAGLLGLPGPVRSASELLDRLFVGHIGDVYTYLTTRLIRASVRGAAEAAVEPSLRPTHTDCLGLTVIAHSWGTVVALDTLLALSRRSDLETRPLTFITVGGALNRTWRLQREDSLWQDLGQMRDWLTEIRWINLWSRYDPVPAGPLDKDLWDHLFGAGAIVFERRVVNLDDPTSDHTVYWGNLPEVQSILAHEALGHPRPADPGVLESLAQRAPRRARVRQLATARLGAIGWAAALAAALPLSEPRIALLSAGLLVVGLLAAIVSVVSPPVRRFVIGVILGVILGATALVGLGSGQVLAGPFNAIRLAVDWFDARSVLTLVLIDFSLLLGLYKIVRYLVFGPWIDHPRSRRTSNDGLDEARGSVGTTPPVTKPKAVL